MILKEIKEAMAEGRICRVYGLPKFIGRKVVIKELIMPDKEMDKAKQENEEVKHTGRFYAKVEDIDTHEEMQLHIRYIGKDRKPNEPTPFPEDKREKFEKDEKLDYEACRLLGQNSRYIFRTLQKELMAALNKTMMAYVTHSKKRNIYKDDEILKEFVVEATTRLKHYVNSAMLAYRAAEQIVPGDHDFAMGVAVCAMLHDFGQCPFGHAGEKALEDASAEHQCGPVLHNVIGALRLHFRERDFIANAINRGRLVEEKAREKVKQQQDKEGFDDKEYDKRVRKVIEGIENGLDRGYNDENDEFFDLLETIDFDELQEKIDENEVRNSEDGKLDRAINLIVMSAGNHNGERGTANIVPDFSANDFKTFLERMKQTHLDKDANKNLPTCNIIDSIVKLTDQISSIPLDMIDGKRAGIENVISEAWELPVSRLLRTKKENVRTVFNDNDEVLLNLALDIQAKFIDSMGEESNPRKISMSEAMSALLYGRDGKDKIIGVRTPNMDEHILYASTEEGGIVLHNMIASLVDELVNETLKSEKVKSKNGESVAFHEELNMLFKMDKTNPMREGEIERLREYISREGVRKTGVGRFS